MAVNTIKILLLILDALKFSLTGVLTTILNFFEFDETAF